MCECECKLDARNTPIILGGLIVYELAVIIILLAYLCVNVNTVPENPPQDNVNTPCCD